MLLLGGFIPGHPHDTDAARGPAKSVAINFARTSLSLELYMPTKAFPPAGLPDTDALPLRQALPQPNGLHLLFYCVF